MAILANRAMNPKLSFASARDYCSRLASFVAEMQVTDRMRNRLDFEAAVSHVLAELETARQNQQKVMVVGNGGSAAIATHMQNDLNKTVRVRALTFYDISFYTALANDEGVETVFEQPVRLFAERGDIFIAISSSGRSENILRAVREARTRNCKIITLSGFKSDNPLRQMGDINFYVPVQHYGMVELAHQVLVHCITDLAMNSPGSTRHA